MKVLLTAFAFLLAVWTMMQIVKGPPTKADAFSSDTADCVREKGYGHWFGSSGLSLEDFCKATIMVMALQKDRAAHPERY